MRKIEQQMNAAIRSLANGRTDRGWTSGNTIVASAGDRAKVFLHGNHIADVFYADDKVEVNQATLYRWDTPTTKSRLRALGCNVYTRKGVVYLDDQPVNA
jgi:hypothetical protein